MAFTPNARPGTLHQYAPRLVAFEHRPRPAAPEATNFVLFFGGLGDSLLTVRYPAVLAAQLPATWALAEVELSSSGIGWTRTDLQHDAAEAGAAVAYFRALATQRLAAPAAARIVLVGHSTGAQITTTYLIGPWKEAAAPPPPPPVDGLVLQAGISDREGAAVELPAADIAASLALAKEWVARGRGADVLPATPATSVFVAAPSAARWVSLMDPDGDDDLFSSDLGDARVERVWGAGGLGGRGVRVLVLLGAADEHMPLHVDRAGLARRWGDAVRAAGGVWDEGSGVVPGATHNLNTAGEDGAMRDLCGRIVAMVERL